MNGKYWQPGWLHSILGLCIGRMENRMDIAISIWGLQCFFSYIGVIYKDNAKMDTTILYIGVIYPPQANVNSTRPLFKRQ